MEKTFYEIKALLDKNHMLISYMQRGELYDINGFRSMKVEGDFYHKIMVVRPDEEIFTESVTFLAQRGKFTDLQGLQLIERSENGYPFQLLVVNDLDAAEELIRSYLSDKKEEPVKAPQAIKTLEEIKATPKKSWIDRHDHAGNCLFCGQPLPAFHDCRLRYGDCDCECGKAAAEHNRHLLEDDD